MNGWPGSIPQIGLSRFHSKQPERIPQLKELCRLAPLDSNLELEVLRLD